MKNINLGRVAATLWFFCSALSYMFGHEGPAIYFFGMGLMDVYHSKGVV